MNRKVLIAYFSRAGNNYVNGSIVNLPVGNTEVAMKTVARLTGGSLFKIEPVKKYSTDYTTCTEEAKKDQQSNARLELAEYLDSVDEYETIILGYPNYWGTMPMPVFTFLERYSFKGKTILPLCTHEGSGMGHREGDIKKLCVGADVRMGLAILGSDVKSSQNSIEHWLKSNGLYE
jgi:flavodoxin